MTAGITIPDDALRYILFQRTAYLVIAKTALFRAIQRLSPWPLYKPVVGLEAALRKNRVRQLFNKDMADEYDRIKRFLPDTCRRVLDVGCGVAGIDVLLHRHYDRDPTLQFYLLDKTGTSENVYYGFEKHGAFYNSLDVARELLVRNGVPRENVHCLDATPDYRIDVETGVDLVISLLSWGFHYGVSTYLEPVHRVLRPGGHLIIDVRKGVGGEDEFARMFTTVQTLHEAAKYARLLATK